MEQAGYMFQAEIILFTEMGWWWQTTVCQLLNKEAQLFTSNEFLSENQIPVLPRECDHVFSALPSAIKTLFSSTTRPPPTFTLQMTQTHSHPFWSHKANNQCIREWIQRDRISEAACVFVWNSFYPETDWEKAGLLPGTCFVSNKVREASLKIWVSFMSLFFLSVTFFIWFLHYYHYVFVLFFPQTASPPPFLVSITVTLYIALCK